MLTLPGLKTLQQNPIYQRERGGWGSSNRYYANLSRYSPFIILAVIILGICSALNPAIYTGIEAADTLAAVWVLLCLPGLLLTMLTLYGSLMAPALTAPLISAERAHQTWDVLRTTPYSLNTILLAKLFGALSRLRIWPVLFLLTLFQGFATFCLLVLAGSNVAAYSWLVGLIVLTRPWLEILFAAFAGMFISTVVRSASNALVAAYTTVVLFKLLNSSAAWLVITNYYGEASSFSYIVTLAGPTLVYGTAVLLLWLGIVRQARKLADE